jgi:hypothetical protein
MKNDPKFLNFRFSRLNFQQAFVLAMLTSGFLCPENAWSRNLKLVRLTVRTERCWTISGGPRPKSEPSPLPSSAACPPLSAKFLVTGNCLNQNDLSSCRFRRKFRNGDNGVSEIRLPQGIYQFNWAEVPPLGGCGCSIGGAASVKVSTSGEKVTLRMDCRCQAP